MSERETERVREKARDKKESKSDSRSFSFSLTLDLTQWFLSILKSWLTTQRISGNAIREWVSELERELGERERERVGGEVFKGFATCIQYSLLR